MSYLRTVGAGCLIALLGACIAASDQDRTADHVFLNGRVYTANAGQPWAEAIAVTGQNIVYVGDDSGAEAFIGAETAVADLEGKVVLPGLISTHEHPIFFMGLASGLVMENWGDRKPMLKSLQAYIEDNPQGPFYSFGGAYEGMVEIHRQDIDAIIADRPFVMIASSGHGGWANTKALETAGITRDQPDPIDYFERDEDGTPTGYIGSAAAAMHLVSELNLTQKDAVLAEADEVLGFVSSQGVTAVYDAGVAPGSEDSLFSAIAELERGDGLPVRIVASVGAQRPVHIEGALAGLAKYGPMYSSELFRVTTLKVWGDGDLGGLTAGLLEPFTAFPDTRGLVAFPDQEQLDRFVLDAVELGYDVHLHAVGDWANRVALDAFEAVREAGFEDARLSTGHNVLIDAQDRPRYKELDVTLNTFATDIAVPDEGWTWGLGEERAAAKMPMGSFARNGVRVTLSADWPTEDLNPFLQMYTAMTRSRLGEDDSAPEAAERLTLEEAVRAYTTDAAYQIRMEDIIGSIEVGKRADLIIIDRDIFDIPTDDIPGTNVLVTMMNGKIVHDEAVDPSSENPFEGFEDFDVCGDLTFDDGDLQPAND